LEGGRQKFALVKLIMDLIGTSLSESKKIVDSKNSVVLTTKDLKKAEIIKCQLENCGASVVIK
jgi:ribosomal protein L7/L12